MTTRTTAHTYTRSACSSWFIESFGYRSLLHFTVLSSISVNLENISTSSDIGYAHQNIGAFRNVKYFILAKLKQYSQRKLFQRREKKPMALLNNGFKWLLNKKFKLNKSTTKELNYKRNCKQKENTFYGKRIFVLFVMFFFVALTS